jgi:hypothetical protein
VKLRFQADADLKRSIVLGLQRYSKEVDFQTAEASRLAGLEDILVLELAAKQNRVLVSHDQSTMEIHFRRFVRDNSSPGLILIPQRVPIGSALNGLQLIWEILEPVDIENRICLLPSLVVYAP